MYASASALVTLLLLHPQTFVLRLEYKAYHRLCQPFSKKSFLPHKVRDFRSKIGEELNRVRIIGKAVAFVSAVR